MSDTNIAWADKVWNPATGCTKCSPGCEHCYAEVMAKRLKGMGQAKYKNGFKVTLHEQCLTEPLKWRKPKTIFVCSMSDLFHPDVPDAFLDKVFAVMALCQQHTFVLCTKRAERMREYLTTPGIPNTIGCWEESFSRRTGLSRHVGPWEPTTLPLPNVHLGVTVESSDQLERAHHLIRTPAAHHWLSYEPALGRLLIDTTARGPRAEIPSDRHLVGLGSVVIGCESGQNRRPFDLDWARQVRDDCQAAGVKVFVKQLNIDGKVVTDVAKFPADLRQRELAWELKK